MLLILNQAIMRRWREREFGGYKQVKWAKRWREIMNTHVLVVNDSNEVTEVSSLFVSLYVQLPVCLNFTLCVNWWVLHNINNNVIQNPHKLCNGQLQLTQLIMCMLDLGEPIINICLTIQFLIVNACILAHLNHMEPLFIFSVCSCAYLTMTLMWKGSVYKPFCGHTVGFEYDPGAKAIGRITATLVYFACINAQILFQLHSISYLEHTS